jgi:XisH protein
VNLKQRDSQYLIYQTFLSITHPDHKVYLAVGNKIYEKFFTQIAIKLILEKYQVLLLVVDINKEEIIKWTN